MEQSRPIVNKRMQGREAEEIARQYLTQLGYEMIEQNWQIRSGEIDLIAMDEDTLVFVEVRSRHKSGRFGSAAESVDYRKQLKIRRLAEVYMMQHAFADKNVRFDVVAITNDHREKKINHIKNAF